MDNGNEVRDFLVSRRARITPAEAGVVNDGSLRRVPGLRRREVAVLAGVSIEYYTRLERGNLSGVSDSVLEAVGRALHLDEAERAHLFDLARAQGPARKRAVAARSRSAPRCRPPWTRSPAALRSSATAGWMCWAPTCWAAPSTTRCSRTGVKPPNLARFAFLDDRAHRFYPDWDRAADDTVAILRTEAGRDPYDDDLTTLVGMLSTRSPEFRQRWAAHNVKQHYSGKKHFHHPDVGDLYLTYQALDLFAEQGLSLLVYTPQPGTGTDEALRLLASWSAAPAGSKADMPAEAP